MAWLCCLYRLKPGTDLDAWDEFVRESDIPLTHRMPSVLSYRVHRVGATTEGRIAFDYLELLEFRTPGSLEQDMAGEIWKAGMDAMYANGLEEEVCFYLDEAIATVDR